MRVWLSIYFCWTIPANKHYISVCHEIYNIFQSFCTGPALSLRVYYSCLLVICIEENNSHLIITWLLLLVTSCHYSCRGYCVCTWSARDCLCILLVTCREGNSLINYSCLERRNDVKQDMLTIKINHMPAMQISFITPHILL